VFATLCENSYSCLHETVRPDRQRLWDCVVTFVRWQHHAMDLLCLALFFSHVNLVIVHSLCVLTTKTKNQFSQDICIKDPKNKSIVVSSGTPLFCLTVVHVLSVTLLRIPWWHVVTEAVHWQSFTWPRTNNYTPLCIPRRPFQLHVSRLYVMFPHDFFSASKVSQFHYDLYVTF